MIDRAGWRRTALSANCFAGLISAAPSGNLSCRMAFSWRGSGGAALSSWRPLQFVASSALANLNAHKSTASTTSFVGTACATCGLRAASAPAGNPTLQIRYVHGHRLRWWSAQSARRAAVYASHINGVKQQRRFRLGIGRCGSDRGIRRPV